MGIHKSEPVLLNVRHYAVNNFVLLKTDWVALDIFQYWFIVISTYNAFIWYHIIYNHCQNILWFKYVIFGLSLSCVGLIICLNVDSLRDYGSLIIHPHLRANLKYYESLTIVIFAIWLQQQATKVLYISLNSLEWISTITFSYSYSVPIISKKIS